MTQRYPLLPRFLFFGYCACVHAQLLQSCLTLCNLMDYSPWGFFRQEYWRGLPCPSPGDLSNPEIPLKPYALQADSLPLSYHGSSLVIAIVQSLSCVQLFGPHGLQHTRLPCSSPYPKACSNSCLLSQ